jgi:hypothetical protein
LRAIPADYTEHPLRIVIMTPVISVVSQPFKFLGANYHDRRIEIA